MKDDDYVHMSSASEDSEAESDTNNSRRKRKTNSGRPRDRIWKHFVREPVDQNMEQTSEDSKRKIRHTYKCKICQRGRLSGQASRLRMHYEKCSRLRRCEGMILSSRVPIPSSSVVLPESDVPVSVIPPAPCPVPVLEQKARVGVKTGNNKPRSAVWTHFTELLISGSETGKKPLQQCNYCQKKVSPQPKRLVNHLNKCTRFLNSTNACVGELGSISATPFPTSS